MERTALHVELFHGPVTSTEATFYAQIEKPAPNGQFELRGQLRGPTNQHAETLPATLKFVDAGPGDTVLARVRVPDPCGWSMDLPSLYEVELELTADDQPSQRWQGVTGFRDFGTAGSSFSLNGERWVVRGKSLAPDAAFDVDAWREERLVCFCESPNESMLRTASEQGASLLVRLTDGGSNNDLFRNLSQIAAWPAVLGFVLPHSVEIPASLSKTTTNVAIGCFADLETVTRMSSIPENERQIGFACVQPEVARELSQNGQRTLPIVVVSDKAGNRAGIDELQAELTPGNFAGYVVGT